MALPLPRTVRKRLNTKHVAVELFEPVLVGMNLGKERFELHGAVANSFSSTTPCGLVFSDSKKDEKPHFRGNKPDVVLPAGDYLVVRLPEGSITHVLRNAQESNLIAANAWLAVAKDYLDTAKQFSRRVQESSAGVSVPLKKAYDASLFALRAVSVLRATPPFTDDLYSVMGTLKSLGSQIPPEWTRIEKNLRRSVERTAVEGHEELEVPSTPNMVETSLNFALDVVQWASRELTGKSASPQKKTGDEKKVASPRQKAPRNVAVNNLPKKDSKGTKTKPRHK